MKNISVVYILRSNTWTYRFSGSKKRKAASCKILLRNKWNDYTNVSGHVS